MVETPAPGPGVDRQGRAVVDPSQNVLDLVDAAVKRLDDLRTADLAHRRETDRLREHFSEKLRMADAVSNEKLRIAESERINAIRAVDVGAVNRAAEVQGAAATALAAQLVATAEAARTQVAAAAAAQVTSLAAALEPIQKDIRDLRDAQSRGQGGREQGVETTSGNRAWMGLVIAGVAAFSATTLGIAGVVITLLLR